MSTRTKKLVLDCTQQRVYDFIKKHGSITTQQANKELGETRLSARIFELKEKGVNIQDEWVRVTNRFKEPRRVKKYFIGRGAK
jgi:hypothetical protein